MIRCADEESCKRESALSSSVIERRHSMKPESKGIQSP